MNSKERERQLDRLLDEALASYSQAEPRPGFEERILANLSKQPTRRRWWAWQMIPAAVAAMVLIAAMLPVFKLRQSVDRIQVSPSATTKSRASLSPLPARAEPPSRVRSRKPVAAAVRRQEPAEPRQGEFPSKAPLSEQERLLMRLAAQHPEEAALLAQAQQNYHRQAQRFLETGEFPQDLPNDQ